MTYYCKNCNNIVGKWHNEYEFYYTLPYCNGIQSKNFNFIIFLDCENCNKFIGIKCFNVCKYCFGEKEIINEKNLFNWFLKYKQIIEKYLNIDHYCKICNKNDFRWQYWFFKELTFYIK